MAVLAINKLELAGVDPDALLVAAAAGGDTVPNQNDRVFVLVRNGGAGPVTVTVNDVRSSGPEGAAAFNPDVQISVPAGADRFIGVFDPNRFNNDVGHVELTYSDVTSVQVAAFAATRR